MVFYRASERIINSLQAIAHWLKSTAAADEFGRYIIRETIGLQSALKMRIKGTANSAKYKYCVEWL